MARLRLLYGDVNTAEADIAKGLAEPGVKDAILSANQLPLAQAELALYKRDYPAVLVVLAEQAHWARENEMRLVMAENLLLQGRAYLGMNDTQNAKAVLEEARDLSNTIGTRRLLWQVLAVLGKLELYVGNPGRAAEYRTEARSVLDHIVEHTPPNYRAGFLSLPVVREIMN